MATTASPPSLNDHQLTTLADALLVDAVAPFTWRLAAVLYKRGSETGRALLLRIVAELEHAS